MSQHRDLLRQLKQEFEALRARDDEDIEEERRQHAAKVAELEQRLADEKLSDEEVQELETLLEDMRTHDRNPDFPSAPEPEPDDGSGPINPGDEEPFPADEGEDVGEEPV